MNVPGKLLFLPFSVFLFQPVISFSGSVLEASPLNGVFLLFFGAAYVSSGIVFRLEHKCYIYFCIFLSLPPSHLEGGGLKGLFLVSSMLAVSRTAGVPQESWVLVHFG